MLSSESALRDCQTFYPGSADRISVVRFATQPPADLPDRDPSDVLRAIWLAGQIFLFAEPVLATQESSDRGRCINHSGKRGFDVVVAASGSPEDPREQGYFDSLMRQVKSAVLKRIFAISE